MAPRELTVFTTMIARLLFLFTCPSLVASSYVNVNGVKVTQSVNPQKVNVSLYYETLSPNCSNFIVNNLTRVFNNDLISIINLRLVPWGNAYINKSNNAIVCEHGPDECLLNAVAACVINYWHDVNTHYGLIYCIGFLAIEGRHKEWKSCFNSYGLPPEHVLDCYNSGNGTKLELAYANETAHLNPPHTFVPWVVVNNKPINDDYINFATYVCKAYKGNVPGCMSLSPVVNSTRKGYPVHPVCCAGQAKNLTFSTPAKKMPGARKLHINAPIDDLQIDTVK